MIPYIIYHSADGIHAGRRHYAIHAGKYYAVHALYTCTCRQVLLLHYTCSQTKGRYYGAVSIHAGRYPVLPGTVAIHTVRDYGTVATHAGRDYGYGTVATHIVRVQVGTKHGSKTCRQGLRYGGYTCRQGLRLRFGKLYMQGLWLRYGIYHIHACTYQ